jgi:hypothetical protein
MAQILDHFTGWRRFVGGRSDYVPVSDENYSEILRAIVILALFIALTALMTTMCLDYVCCSSASLAGYGTRNQVSPKIKGKFLACPVHTGYITTFS